MRFVFTLLALLAASLCFASGQEFTAPKPDGLSGYIVSGLWDGRTFPNVQWAFDVARLTTQFEIQEELKLHNFLPTTVGPASFPTWTAYDPISRQYFAAVNQNMTSSYFFSGTLNRAVTNMTNIQSQAFAYPAYGANHMGLEVANLDDNIYLFSFYQSGAVDLIDPNTGARSHFVQLTNSTRQITTAITSNLATGEIYIVAENIPTTKNAWGPQRSIITLQSQTGVFTEKFLAPLKYHDPSLETAFELVWLPPVNCLMLFYTGNFDQLVYLDPTTGTNGYATQNMASFVGGEAGSVLGFSTNDYLMMGDTWGNIAYDQSRNILYFQCSSLSESGASTTLCSIPINWTPVQLTFITVQIWPLSYGFAGMQFVQVLESAEVNEQKNKRNQIEEVARS